MLTNQNILLTFYDAFSQGNTTLMASCYHAQATFSDPAFGKLTREEVVAMWEMLLKRSNGNLSITYSIIKSTEKTGVVKWTATYSFSQTNRQVVNEITAQFEFKEGLIWKHTDNFNLWKWSGMALGWKGYLLGWTPFFQEKIKEKAKKSLANYLKKE
jgi:hypothetical protein